jgi:hypothetical protein
MIVLYILITQWMIAFISSAIIYHNDIRNVVRNEAKSDGLSFFLFVYIPLMGCIGIYVLWATYLSEYHNEKLKKFKKLNYMSLFFGKRKCDRTKQEVRNDKIKKIMK